MTGAELTQLLGRRLERDTVHQLLTEARAGRSGTVVVRGDPGIGKTALLDDVRESAAALGFRVVSCVGVESETLFAYAGLHQLCAPLLDRVDSLPDPQRAALDVALGLRTGASPDRFLVGLATLNLLAEAAEEQPLLCLIDDAQWLDQASALVLGFVARRIDAEGVVLGFALRDSGAGDTDPFSGLEPELRLSGLEDDDARLLLGRGIIAPLDDDVRDRIVAEARGNPLALIELPRGASAARLAGGFELPDVLTVPRRIEDVFQLRSTGLSADARLLLLTAAAESTGDAHLLLRALGRLGNERITAAAAEATGLVEIDEVVRFRHPLVRSAVYKAASPMERRSAHRALANATDAAIDPDRRAWHRAQAVLGEDEDAAAELELTAERTRARGGVAAAAAFLQRATELTPDPGVRARRALAAAHAKHDAGLSQSALELLAIAENFPLDDGQRARIALLRARIAFHLTQGSDVPGMLLDAAATLARLDAALSRETYLHALDAAMVIGGTDQHRDALSIAEAARNAPAPSEPPRPSDLLLDGLVVTLTQGFEAATPSLRRGLEAFRDHGFDGEALGDMGSRRWLWLASRTAMSIFDDELALLLMSRNIQLARDAGALATLPSALVSQSASLVLAGELAQATELSAESSAITAATGVPLHNANVVLAGWRGSRDDVAELTRTTVDSKNTRAEGAKSTLEAYAVAVLNNGLGNYAAAADAAFRASKSHFFSTSSLALPELVEAASRAGQPERALAALDELRVRARAGGTQSALGLVARSAALTSTGAAADELFRDAIERLTSHQMAGYRARTHLVYGEWLRREGQRQSAREQLRLAHDQLTSMGIEAFALRASRELRATGEQPRRKVLQPSTSLTAHELQIARLVATGLTSREVGTQLFLSPRTIDAHLRNIFRKLDITSRRQLRDTPLP